MINYILKIRHKNNLESVVHKANIKYIKKNNKKDKRNNRNNVTSSS